MKRNIFVTLALAIILPAQAQIFTPEAQMKDFDRRVQQTFLFGPVQPDSTFSSGQDRSLATNPENYHKPFLKGSYNRSPSFDSTWAEQFQAALDNILSVNNVPGASLAVYAPGQGFFTAVSGISTEGVPITPEMRFGIGSNTKLFVAVTLLRLQEEGILTLDDHLYEWLPSYSYVDSSTTIRQLLSHESGIFDFWNDNPSMIYDSVAADTSRFWTTDEVLATIGPPHFAPGHGWSYSNTNYMLAALVIEAATGQSWVQNLHEYIFNPLVMDSTFIGAFEPRNGPVSNEYDIFHNMEIENSPMTAEYSQAHAAGGILSAAQEMVAWYYILFSGNLISSSSMEQLTDFDPVSTYGLGLQGLEIWGHPAYYHTGGMFGYLSLTWYDVKTGATMSILYNGRDFSQDPWFPLYSILIQDFPKQINDAGISAIISPWLNNCGGTVTPAVVLNNFGSEPLSSAGINYFIDQEPAAVFGWTGSMEPGETMELSLPALTAGDGTHTFTCYTTSPNGGPEGYTFNDTVTSDFIMNIEPALDAPFMESFDGEVFPPVGWSQGSHIFHDWGGTFLASYSGTGSAVKSNYNDGWVGMHYDLDMPLLDISGGTSVELDFRYAYGWYPGNNLDSLQVFISSDCGVTWNTLFSKGGWQMATAPSTYDLFFPKVPGDWKEMSFSLIDYTGEVLIRFRAVCGFGNNLYLDDVMVNMITGIRESPSLTAFSVYPNPVTSGLLVTGLPANEEIYFTDVAGRLLIHTRTADYTTAIDLGRLPEGIYILKTPFGSRKIVKI